MTHTQDNIISALCFVLGAVAILSTVWVAHEATSVVSATRVALDTERDLHHETRAELAECRKQVNSAAINQATK